MVRQFPGWQITPEDALVLSRPLHELLQKYPKVFSKVLEASTPIALVTGAAWIIGPRVLADIAYQNYVQEARINAARNDTPPQPQSTQAGAQTVPPGPVPPGPVHAAAGSEPVQNGNGPAFPKDLSGIAGWATEPEPSIV
jgi:hypothetical protein